MNQELLQKIDQKKQELDKLRPIAKEKIALWQDKLSIEWTYNSNAIEGNSLTLKETAFFIREGLTVEGKPLKDFLEAKNHTEAIEAVYGIIKNKRPISESLIKELNALVLKGITKIKRKSATGEIFEHIINPGVYKKQPNYVLTLSGEIHNYAKPLEVPDKMQELIAWYNNQKNQKNKIQLASEFHYRFVAIHPFDDCNGRVARLLLNIILMKFGYPPTVILNQDRREYLESLEQADNGNLDNFKNFIARSVLKTMETMQEALKS